MTLETKLPRITRYKRTVLVMTIVFSFIGLAALFNEYVKPRIFPKRFGVVIEDSLYRSGNIHQALLPKVLRDYQIDTIVTLTRSISTIEYQAQERAIAEEMDVALYRFPLFGNGTGDVTSYIGALKRIHEELTRGRRVLVHCAAGTQRTGGVVFFYETLILDYSPAEAYAHMQSFKFDPSKNEALLPYLDGIFPVVASALEDHGIALTNDPLDIMQFAPN